MTYCSYIERTQSPFSILALYNAVHQDEYDEMRKYETLFVDLKLSLYLVSVFYLKKYTHNKHVRSNTFILSIIFTYKNIIIIHLNKVKVTKKSIYTNKMKVCDSVCKIPNMWKNFWNMNFPLDVFRYCWTRDDFTKYNIIRSVWFATFFYRSSDNTQIKALLFFYKLQ